MIAATQQGCHDGDGRKVREMDAKDDGSSAKSFCAARSNERYPKEWKSRCLDVYIEYKSILGMKIGKNLGWKIVRDLIMKDCDASSGKEDYSLTRQDLEYWEKSGGIGLGDGKFKYIDRHFRIMCSSGDLEFRKALDTLIDYFSNKRALAYRDYIHGHRTSDLELSNLFNKHLSGKFFIQVGQRVDSEGIRCGFFVKPTTSDAHQVVFLFFRSKDFSIDSIIASSVKRYGCISPTGIASSLYGDRVIRGHLSTYCDDMYGGEASALITSGYFEAPLKDRGLIIMEPATPYSPIKKYSLPSHKVGLRESLFLGDQDDMHLSYYSPDQCREFIGYDNVEKQSVSELDKLRNEYIVW